MIDTILFDLDGTLLPMDNDTFTKGYFRELSKKLAPLGYAPEQVVSGVWKGTGAMVKNDGSRTNEEAFWSVFQAVMPHWSGDTKSLCDAFYTQEFHNARVFTGENPLARPLVDALRQQGVSLVLATNPLFPAHGVESRLSWIGLSSRDFDLVTTYENMHYCKPNPKYYAEILQMLDKTAEQCLMVGNNVDEDGAAAKAAGIPTVLVTDCLINESQTPIEPYTHCTFAKLQETLTGILQPEA